MTSLLKNRTFSVASSGVGAGGSESMCPPSPNFFKDPKMPFFVMKTAFFVGANVAVKTTVFYHFHMIGWESE